MAECKVLLAVALGDLNGIVHVVDDHAVICDVVDTPGASSAL